MDTPPTNWHRLAQDWLAPNSADRMAERLRTLGMPVPDPDPRHPRERGYTPGEALLRETLGDMHKAGLL